MSTARDRVETKRSGGVKVLRNLVPLMTLYALVINNITIANSDYTLVVLQAVLFAGMGLVLVPAVWRSASRTARLILVGCVVVNLWILVDAGGRRLPAILGL